MTPERYKTRMTELLGIRHPMLCGGHRGIYLLGTMVQGLVAAPARPTTRGTGH
jgi:hypothetical protein